MAKKSKHVFGLLLIAASLGLLLGILGSTAYVSAYGSGENWQLGFAGTGSLAGTPFGFWGWCTFVGQTSGTSGDCQVSQYLHIGGAGNIQCETHFEVTGWTAESGALTPLTNEPDFFVNSGVITVNPASSTGACAAFLQGAGFDVSITGPGTLTIMGPSDTEFPAAPGHYSFNGFAVGPISYTELQIQVSQK
jgi:hypothetical protein